MRPGASWTARDLFTHFASPPRRTHLPPTGSIRCLWVRKSTSLKKSVHLGRNRLPTSETPATGSTADASLLRKRSSDVLDRNSLLLSKCVHSDQRTRRCDRMACYSVQLLLRVMMVCSWYQKKCEESSHGPAGGRAWLRSSVRVRATGTRWRRGRLSLLVPTFRRTRSLLCSKCVLSSARAVVFKISVCYNLLVFHIFAPTTETCIRCLTWEGGTQHCCCHRERSTNPALQEVGFSRGRASA